MSLEGCLPRKYRSSEPGRAMGSNVGLGMNRQIFPPTRSRLRPSMVAHCTPRLRKAGSRYRVKASMAS